ncbi:hypothetical protein BDR26DRAFT_937718 [Obelidium mucronatum]|nr:hypothetical protein BDR26DRAFT_937718 [Obelidium mucronatum]
MNIVPAALPESPIPVPRRRGRPPNSQRFSPQQSSSFASASASNSRKRQRTGEDDGSFEHPPTATNTNAVCEVEESVEQINDKEASSDTGDEYGAFKIASTLHFNEQLALRQQSDWAHNQQKETKIYLEHQKEYKNWCCEQQYPDEFVNDTRMLVFLKHIQSRGLKARGRKSSNTFQRRTTRSIARKITVIERRDKEGEVIYWHPDYEALMNEHKQNFSKDKAARLDDAGLEDITMRVGKTQWRSLTLGLLENKKFIELATLHVDKQAVARHQLARDWHWKDAFLYTLERESVTGGDVVILVGRTNESKTNHFQRAEHFAFFRHKDVMSCAWGWIVELQARGLYSEIAGKTWQKPEVSKRELFYKEKVLGNPTYGKMYKALDEQMKSSGIISKKKAHLSRVSGNMQMLNRSIDPGAMSLATRNRLDSQLACYQFSTYNCLRELTKVPDELLKLAFDFLDDEEAKVNANIESGHYEQFYGSETAISEMDYIRVMRHQQSMLFQDMAEKMDNVEYMTAVGENDPFLNCFLFDNDAFKHEGVQQRTAIMEGVLDANEKLDSLSTEVRSNNAAILRLDCHMAAVLQEQRLIRDEYLRVQALTTSSHATSFMAQAAASMNHAVALNQTAMFVGSMVDQTPMQTAEVLQRVIPTATMPPLATAMTPLATAPQPAVPILPNEPIPVGTAAAMAPSTTAAPPAAVDGDPNIYHFFQLTKGSKISQCFHEFETGLCGKQSVLSIEKEHGVKWRQWMEGGKRINRKTKVYTTRLTIYKYIKKVAKDRFGECCGAAEGAGCVCEGKLQERN